MISLMLLLVSGLFFGQHSKKITDNLPGYFGFNSDLEITFIADVSDAGFFGDKDIVVELYDNKAKKSKGTYYVGTSGREGFAHSGFLNDCIFVTGQSNLNTGSFDDVILSKLDLTNPSNSWVKIHQGDFSDRGKRIYFDDSNIVLLANSNSSTSYFSFNLIIHDFNGNLLTKKEYDFGEAFYPSGFTSNSTHFYVSGYSYSGSKPYGKIIKIDKNNYSVDWCLSFENINGSEINQIEISNSSLYFSGWSGNSINNALFFGEMNLAGDLSWHRIVKHSGLASVTDMVVDESHMYLSGFLRMTDGNEENEMISKISLNTKELDLYSNETEDRSYLTSQIHQKDDTLFVGSYSISPSTLRNGKLLNWEPLNGGCFTPLVYDGFEDHSMFLSLNPFPVAQGASVLLPKIDAGISLSSDEFFVQTSCERAEHIVAVVENNCENQIEVLNGEILFENNCNSVFKKVECYDLFGRLLFFTEINDLTRLQIKDNQFVILIVYWYSPQGELKTSQLKYYNQ